MWDATGRKIEYLRLSVTDRCNLRCCYCRPEDDLPKLTDVQMLTDGELLHVSSLMAGLGVTRIKITGGEPLARENICRLIARIKRIPGIEQVTLTTNGILLAPLLDELKEAGIDGINISLDTFDRAAYWGLTHVDGLPTVLSAIEKTREKGIPLKLNAVGLRGVTETECGRFAAFTRETEVPVRFIEVMPVGCGKIGGGINNREICRHIEERYGGLHPFPERLGNGPARYFTFADGKGTVGFISSISDCFCSTCDRIRLTPQGFLKACLCYARGLNLRALLRGGASDDVVREQILSLVRFKPAKHCFQDTETSGMEKRSMWQIGG